MIANYSKRLLLFLVLVGIVCLTIGMVSASDNATESVSDGADEIVEQAVEPDSNEIISQDDSQSTSSDSPAVTKEKTKITTKSATGKPGKKIKLSATVKTESGKPVKNAKVFFKINGKSYGATTDANGVAVKVIKTPKSKMDVVTSKIKGKILKQTKKYKKTYNCDVTFDGNNDTTSSKSTFKVTSKTSKVQKYKILSKKQKSVDVPVKKSSNHKIVGKYVFVVGHEKSNGKHYLAVIAGSKIQGFIKFKSNIFVKYHGKKIYAFKKWSKSKHAGDYHQYSYGDISKVYVAIKYTQLKCKKI